MKLTSEMLVFYFFEMLETREECYSIITILQELTANFQYFKGVYKQEGKQLFLWADNDRTRGNNFELGKGRFRLDVREKFFTESGEALAQAAQTVCRYPHPLEVFKASLDGPHLVPDLLCGNSSQCRRVGIRLSLKFLSTQDIL